MIHIGRTQKLKVKSEGSAGYLLSKDGDEVLLPRKLANDETHVGAELEVFVYTDSEDRPVATTQKPLAEVGDFRLLKVIDENVHGAFLDWGLDKDLFVPRSEQHEPMVVGRSYVVAVFLDNRTERVAAGSRLAEFFDYDLSPLQVGEKVPLLVYGHKEQGAQVLVSDRYSGLVYHSESFVDLKVGDRLEGFISDIRKDNKLDIRLQRVGADGQKDASARILEALAESNGELPLGDKSPPEEIYKQLGLSKKVFKATIGQLYKAGRVQPAPHSLRLIKKDS